MNINEAREKVAKLLRLSKSENPNEAALAASRAQEIMDRFKIESMSLEYEQTGAIKNDEPINIFEHDPLDPGTGKRSVWKGRLAVVISRLNQCKVYTNGGAIVIVGRPSDVSTVRYLYAWMVREITRITDRDCAGCGRTYYNNFRNGAVDTISAKMNEASKATVKTVKLEAVSQHALMVVETSIAMREQQLAEVEFFTAAKVPGLRKITTYSRNDVSARDAGRKAAREINLRPAAGSLRNQVAGHLA